MENDQCETDKKIIISVLSGNYEIKDENYKLAFYHLIERSLIEGRITANDPIDTGMCGKDIPETLFELLFACIFYTCRLKEKHQDTFIFFVLKLFLEYGDLQDEDVSRAMHFIRNHRLCNECGNILKDKIKEIETYSHGTKPAKR